MKGKYKRETSDFKETNQKEIIEVSKLLAGQTDWASEVRVIPVVRKGGNISLSLHISCVGRDTTQLMAFSVISYLYLPLHSHLDPSPTEHFLLSSWNTHPILTHHSNDEALPLHLSLPPISVQLCFILCMNHEPPSIQMNPGHSPWKSTDNTRLQGYKYLCECGFLSFLLAFFPHWVTTCNVKMR